MQRIFYTVLFLLLTIGGKVSFANECSSCYEECTESFSSCAHRLCLSCSNDYLEIYLQDHQDEVDSVDREGASCPQCRQKLFVPQDRRSKNLKELITRLKADLKDKRERQSKQISFIKEQIEATLVPRCPNPLCRHPIPPVTDSCNVAYCDACHSSFCMFCRKLGGAGEDLHAHVLDNHGHLFNYGDNGAFLARHHWLFSRQNIANLFLTLEPESVHTALEQLQNTLREADLWPFAEGKETREWLGLVLEDPLWQKDKKITVLQNEGIYRHGIGDRHGFELIKTKLAELGSAAPISLNKNEEREAVQRLYQERQNVYLQKLSHEFLRVNPALTSLRQTLTQTANDALSLLRQGDGHQLTLAASSKSLQTLQIAFLKCLVDPVNLLKLSYTILPNGDLNIRCQRMEAQQEGREAREACLEMLNDHAKEEHQLEPASDEARELQHRIAHNLGFTSSSEGIGPLRHVVIGRP